ncbi:EpsI family protein [Terriglobus roseus DSM 18391]|uniref:EpsI family protein n=1 Tax=Terriglobus roseus (strain DSM 18391 / NRRL B-41598 / KBS 63) TaxID=926566 RepID=I3ZII7_TERRK|nr:exosortase C-terminal domain/associated protein EpsI [Terriglobus roseus]AFL89055.1 EpsI family protein [Terriglobus roseus DSM 18391]
MSRVNWKATTLVLLLAATALTLRIRGEGDLVIPATPLQDLSTTIGKWQGTDLPMAPDVLQVLGDGSFLNRNYREAATAAPPIDLLIAYFPTQRSGQSIHSPQNCLPGAGWTFEAGGQLDLTDTTGKPHHVAEYVVTNGTARYEVLYWYRSQGRDIASDYAAKGYLLLQSIRDRRTDGALLRIMTPIAPGEPQSAARARAVSFTASLNPLLSTYLPD